jgi:hypothetical protein
VREAFGQDDGRAGGPREWLQSFRNHLIEAKDRTFELTVSRAGTALWDEMKENARLASYDPAENGVMQLLVKHAREALRSLSAANRRRWELHVVAHSAGAIYGAYALDQLASLGVNFRSFAFMAPAITVADFKRLVVPHLKANTVPHPSLFILSDQGERDDDVGPYGKSLLYLVSNAFEGRFDTPLLGMQKYVQTLEDGPRPDADVQKVFMQSVAGRPSLIISGAAGRDVDIDACNRGVARSETHGGFDNDEWTLNSILWRILGSKPTRPFVLRDLQY